MRKDRFEELAAKFDTFYCTYKKTNTPGKTYLVGTHNLDTKYIRAELAKAPEHIRALVNSPNDEQVVLFSYSTNRFRVLNYADITRLSMLSVELDRHGKR
ncbi:hypothetical protein [Vibrio phage VCPH]|nr:hypothetical protein [Vibrio phage VCPH]